MWCLTDLFIKVPMPLILFSISYFLGNKGESQGSKTSSDNKTTIIIVVVVLLVTTYIVAIVAIIIIRGKKRKWLKGENCLF